jgi:hypothetical protein
VAIPGLQSRVIGTRQGIVRRKEKKMKSYPSHIGLAALIGGIVFLLTTTAALAFNQKLVGAVIKTDQGVALSTAHGEYLPLGRRLAGMEGKTLAITGNVENGVESSTVQVHGIKVLADKDTIDHAVRTSGSGIR